MQRVDLYDTTLRDGAQGEGIVFSLEDKLHITQRLDALGVHYIEGGWPGSNPKDAAYFLRVRDLPLKTATVAAFGSTRRANTPPEQDVNLQTLLAAGTKVVTLVGKSSAPQVDQVLRTSRDENLAMIADSIRYLREHGRRLFFDAEHFFDGYKADAAYALQCLRAAAEAGAETIVLCDTNGSALPGDITTAIRAVRDAIPTPLGIHVHNDADLAVANSLAAIEAGATQVQGTVNGIGERCGNANLCSIIPNLQIKMGIRVVSDEQLAQMTDISRFVHELAHTRGSSQQPYVGLSAFTHKGGLHADATAKWDMAYQHIDPKLVGNARRMVASELSGRSNILAKAQQFGLTLSNEEAVEVLRQVKERESQGFQYDTADASLDLLMRRRRPGYERPFPFDQLDFFVKVDKLRRSAADPESEVLAEAMVKFWHPGTSEPEYAADHGSGPVNALDRALRKLLLPAVGSAALERVELRDYRVRVVEGTDGTAAAVRVIIESGMLPEREAQNPTTWSTVGCSTNIIEASWQALVDSYEYWMCRYAS